MLVSGGGGVCRDRSSGNQQLKLTKCSRSKRGEAYCVPLPMSLYDHTEILNVL